MKKLLCAFLAMALVILPVGGSMVAYAEDVTVPIVSCSSDTVFASGESGTVTWTLYDDGELNLAPTSGDEGTLELEILDDETGYPDIPWDSYGSSIKSVTITGTVHAGSTMNYMFASCYSLTTVDLSGLDTSSVTDMVGMFLDCILLTTVDMSSMDMSSVTDADIMFSLCSSLTTVNMSGLNVTSVTDMSYMFDTCRALTTVNMSGLNASSVTDMSHMFDTCDALITADLSGFDMSSVTNMEDMFVNCESLTKLDLSSFDMSSVEYRNEMFECSSLQSITLGKSWNWTDKNGNVITSEEEGLLDGLACWSKVKSSTNGKITYDSSYGELTSEQLAAQWTSDYAGTWVRTGTVSYSLKAQKITVKKSQLTKTIHTKKLKKKNQTFKLKASTSGNGKITYKKTSGNKKIKVSKTGKVTVKKGLKKGKTYKVKVKVTAAKTSTYKKATKTVTLKIKIK